MAGSNTAGLELARRGTTTLPSLYSIGCNSASGIRQHERLAQHFVDVLDEHERERLEHAARHVAQILPVLLGDDHRA